MSGYVYLVGAGPGDPNLITLKGLNCIRQADVIVYDRLANNRILSEAKDDCEFIYVGKKSGKHTKTQAEINYILYQKALEGNVVVRFKGGDPYVFGRGGEEGIYLKDRGISFEVVPGITSAIGGLAYGGIPITHRDFASSFHVITGHLKDEDDDLNWEVLAKLKGTLVFLMGVSNLKCICFNLLKYGMNIETPVAIINWASTPIQKTVVGNLTNIYDKAILEGIKSPSLIVVGHVVSLKKELDFYEKSPLFGETFVVTRPKTQNYRLVEELERNGANVIEFPTIRVKEIEETIELESAIKDISKYTYIVFTSQNAVKLFFKRLFSLGYDSRHLSRLKVASIGPLTGSAIEKYGIKPDYIPSEFIAEGLVEELKKELNPNDKVLIPRACEVRPYLVEELSKICTVEEVKIYEIVKEYRSEYLIDSLINLENQKFIFTSPSTFENFIDIIGDENKDILYRGKILSIGPITSNAIIKSGFDVHMEAKEYTVDGILNMILKENQRDGNNK